MRFILLVSAVGLLSGKAWAYDVPFDSLSLLDVHLPPVEAVADIDFQNPVATYDCPIGGYRTPCLLPRYSREQLLRFTDIDGSGLPEDLLESLPTDELLGWLNSSIRSRYMAGAFEIGPLPVFPIPLFAPVDARMRADAPTFDRDSFHAELRELTIDNFVEGIDLLPLWWTTPMSFESIEGSDLLSSAWEAWRRLAADSEDACAYAETGCELPQIVVGFVDGPTDMVSGFAVCRNPADGPPSAAAHCTIMAYQTSAGERYVKSLFGPAVGISAGGYVMNSAGLIELLCSDHDEKDIFEARQSIASVLETPRYRAEASLRTEFQQPKILEAVNFGERLEEFGGNFVFLHVTAYFYDVGSLSLHVMARGWLRAERDPPNYPVFSPSAARRLANFLVDDLSTTGFQCTLF